MMNSSLLQQLLNCYGISGNKISAELLGNGLINNTWKITGAEQQYILQEVNTHVFKNPQVIDDNLTKIRQYLSVHHPNYLFVAPLPARNGATLVTIAGERRFRLFTFISDTVTVNVLSDPQQAYEAAAQFGRLTRILDGFDPGELVATIPNFHNLTYRFELFKAAYAQSDTHRLNEAGFVIRRIVEHRDLLHTFRHIVENDFLRNRVIHHDTKIANVLFDRHGQALCVVDLDTIMPGYFTSDVGDMIRTYVCPVDENEQDIHKIIIREDYFLAIYRGYMEQMGDRLTHTEKKYFIYAGKMMIYMQALRFLTDYLNHDVYYYTEYTGQNLARASNQLTLLQQFESAESRLQALILQNA